MPDTSVKLKPPPTRARADLKAAFEALKKAEAHVTSLTEGAERAREKSWAAAGDVETRQETLARLQADEQRRLASAWVADDTVVASPIPAAEHELTQARAALENIRKVKTALASEIGPARSKLGDAQRAFFAELATYVTASKSYSDLCAAHRDCWKKLRSVRAALAAVNTAIGGAMPTAFFEAAQRSESLATNVPGASFDKEFVQEWADAMSEIVRDPEHAELPD